MKLPEELPAPEPCAHVVSHETNTGWLGLDVTVTVIVIGLLAVPLASQVAKSPCALQEPIVPALATALVAATPASAMNPVIDTLAARRRNLFKVQPPPIVILRTPDIRRAITADGLHVHSGLYTPIGISSDGIP